MEIRPIIYNKLLNPQQSEEYISEYLDKRRYYKISTKVAQFDYNLDFSINRYQVTTDNSILPWENNK